MSTKEFTIENDEGEEVTMDLPTKMEVCDECGGHGTVLCEGMRGHAYTAEEFEEAFDDEEDREAYFSHGGKYDVQCHVCKGANVVPGVDEDALSSEQKEFYKQWQDQEYDRACSRAEDRATRRAECGYRD